MKVGDVSRRRRLADPARQAWYAYRRSVRFALRMRQLPHPETPEPLAYMRRHPPVAAASLLQLG